MSDVTLGKLPLQYQYLLRERLPEYLKTAISFYGLKETKGKENNPAILTMAARLNPAVESWYIDDEKAWCGVFVGYCLKTAGEDIPGGFDAIRALKYADVGIHQSKAGLGDVLIFKREGGGHVGFYVGEDKDNFYVLGGNQGDMVKIVPIEKSRLEGITRPAKAAKRFDFYQFKISTGESVSRNEA